jgi:hypothetical protein
MANRFIATALFAFASAWSARYAFGCEQVGDLLTETEQGTWQLDIRHRYLFAFDFVNLLFDLG